MSTSLPFPYHLRRTQDIGVTHRKYIKWRMGVTEFLLILDTQKIKVRDRLIILSVAPSMSQISDGVAYCLTFRPKWAYVVDQHSNFYEKYWNRRVRLNSSPTPLVGSWLSRRYIRLARRISRHSLQSSAQHRDAYLSGHCNDYNNNNNNGSRQFFTSVGQWRRQTQPRRGVQQFHGCLGLKLLCTIVDSKVLGIKHFPVGARRRG